MILISLGYTRGAGEVGRELGANNSVKNQFLIVGNITGHNKVGELLVLETRPASIPKN